MKKLFIILIISLQGINLMSQNEKTVTVKGIGYHTDKTKAQELALQDARRKAISEVCGTYLKTETQVQNFVTVSDAIATNAQGYIKSEKIIKEIPFPDKYEITMEATVSTDPLKMDAATLDDMVGGINFIVIYDDANLTAEQKDYYDHAYEKINQMLNAKGYERYEASLIKDIKELLPSGLGETQYISAVGLYSNVEYVIQIKKLEITTKEDALSNFRSTAYIEFKCFDASNFRNLGTKDGRSEYKASSDKKKSVYDAIDEAIRMNFEGLMMQFYQDIYSWINRGAPYEFRCYSFGQISTLNWYTLLNKLKEQPNFCVGDPKDEKTNDFVVIRLKSKRSRFNVLSTFYMTMLEIPEFKAIAPEEKIKYARQISLVPQGTIVPDIEKKIEIRKKLGTQ